MKLYSVNIKNSTSSLIKDNCTVGKAFTFIDHWCQDNEAWYDVENMWLDTNGPGTRAKINVKCFNNNNKGIATIFEIKY